MRQAHQDQLAAQEREAKQREAALKVQGPFRGFQAAEWG